MTVTPATLRAAFPEFANSTAYPDTQINFWLPIASEFVGSDRWGNLVDLGVTLYVCHHLALSAKAVKQAATGGVPGMAVGVVNNRSVDKVSIGYDVNVATYKDAGFWNQTTYGTRFWHYVQLFGAGAIVANLPGYDPQGAAATWPGPLIYPGY